MSQEILRHCPEGYREASFAELQELMNQTIMMQRVQGDVATLNATLAAAEATLEATRLKLKNKLSEQNLVREQMERTNARLGIGVEPGELLEDTGALYICVDKLKRIKELPSQKRNATVTITGSDGKRETKELP